MDVICELSEGFLELIGKDKLDFVVVICRFNDEVFKIICKELVVWVMVKGKCFV